MVTVLFGKHETTDRRRRGEGLAEVVAADPPLTSLSRQAKALGQSTAGRPRRRRATTGGARRTGPLAAATARQPPRPPRRRAPRQERECRPPHRGLSTPPHHRTAARHALGPRDHLTMRSLPYCPPPPRLSPPAFHVVVVVVHGTRAPATSELTGHSCSRPPSSSVTRVAHSVLWT